MSYYWSYLIRETGEIGEKVKPYTSEAKAKSAALTHLKRRNLEKWQFSIKITTEPYPYSREK